MFSRDVQTRPIADIIYFMTSPDSTNCQSPVDCNEARLRTLRMFPFEEMEVANIFTAWHEMFWGYFQGQGCCHPCWYHGRDLQDARTIIFWNELPKLFGLPAWHQLEERRRISLAENPA